MRRTSRQQALLVITTVKQDHREALDALFDEMVDCDVEDNQWVPFASLTTVHFARWAILPASVDVEGRRIPDRLFFSSNYDAPLDGHLAELVDVAGESGRHVIYTLMEMLGAVGWLHLVRQGEPMWGALVLPVGLSIEHVLQGSQLKPDGGPS